MSGTLYGLGIGPGDPELITLKALKCLQSAARSSPIRRPRRAIAWPARSSPSISTAGSARSPSACPWWRTRFPAQEVYDRAAEAIGGELEGGCDVAVLCEGDPFFYGSFMYLFARMAERHFRSR